VSAVGIAAHETGHALQHAEGYWPLQARSAIVPAVQFGSFLGPLVFLAGMLFLGQQVAWLGVILFSAVVVFALVTLPVEFDASRRAKELLASAGFAVGDELTGVSRVLDAAALTYVAGLAQALTTLLYYVFILTGTGRRRS
jgi:Zn-dependent membrane protease YugP